MTQRHGLRIPSVNRRRRPQSRSREGSAKQRHRRGTQISCRRPDRPPSPGIAEQCGAWRNRLWLRTVPRAGEESMVLCAPRFPANRTSNLFPCSVRNYGGSGGKFRAHDLLYQCFTFGRPGPDKTVLAGFAEPTRWAFRSGSRVSAAPCSAVRSLFHLEVHPLRRATWLRIRQHVAHDEFQHVGPRLHFVAKRQSAADSNA